MGDEDKKKGWYPGKYARSMSTRRSSDDHGGDRGSARLHSSPSPNGGKKISFESNDSEHDLISRDDTQIINTTVDAYNLGDSSSTSAKPPAIAVVKFKLIESRFLTIQSPKLTIELDGVASVFQPFESGTTIERQFDLMDVTSDLKLEFSGTHLTTGQPAFGIVIIPITSCFSFTGKPIAAQPAWREIYPYYEKKRLLDSPQIRKFRSGFLDLPGSAMTKPIESLGFIQCSIEVVPMKGKSGFPLFFAPSPPRSNALHSLIKAPENDFEGTEATIALGNARVNRDIERLKNALFRAPAIIQPFFSLPEVFVLITVFGFTCFAFSPSQLPLVFVFALLFNGLWANSNRKFSHVLMWNEIGGATSISATLSATGEEEGKKSLGVSSVVFSVLKYNQNLQRQLANAAHNIEVLNNIFTFAEPRVSLVVYGLLFALAIFAKIWISFFSFASFIFLLGGLVFISFASAEFLNDQILLLHPSSVYHKHISLFRKIYGFFCILWSKVPDDLELTHRYIASLCLVKELGGEMAESANNFAARTAKEKDSKK